MATNIFKMNLAVEACVFLWAQISFQIVLFNVNSLPIKQMSAKIKLLVTDLPLSIVPIQICLFIYLYLITNNW